MVAAAEHRFDGGSGRAPGVEHIIAENNVPVVHVERQLRLADDRALGKRREIVPVEADVDAPAGRLNALNLLDVVAYAAGDRFAPAAYPDEDDVIYPSVLLGDLMGYAHQRSAECGLVHYLSLLPHGCIPFRQKINALPVSGKTHKSTGALHP